MSPYDIIIAPWITEKSMEARRNDEFMTINRLEFLINKKATKADVAEAVEKLFDVKVSKVNTRVTKFGKHASGKLAEGYDAEDASMKLGAF